MKITRDNRRLIVDGMGLENSEPLEVTVGYTGASSAFKGIALDHRVLPLLAASADLLEACNAVLNEGRYEGPDGDFVIWGAGDAVDDNDPPAIAKLKAAIAKATEGNQ